MAGPEAKRPSRGAVGAIEGSRQKTSDAAIDVTGCFVLLWRDPHDTLEMRVPYFTVCTFGLVVG
jgi:hypothetical protein